MPPAAATECERTGCTLLMIATEAPSSAAARAARWPARPAPMIRTSCAGMARRTISVDSPGPTAPGGRTDRRAWARSAVDDRPGHGRGEGAADLLDRHGSAQALLGGAHPPGAPPP